MTTTTTTPTIQLIDLPNLELLEGALPPSEDYYRAVAYTRQSKGEEESLAEQRGSVPRWAKAAADKLGKPVRVIAIITDATGAWAHADDIPPVRPGWDGLNAALPHGLFDLVLAREQSRLSRDEDEPTIFYRRARRCGIETFTSMEGHVSAQDLGTRILTKIKAVTNNEESSTTSKRIRENRVEKRECGFWLGGPVPTGWWPRGGKYVEEVDAKGRTVSRLQADRVARTHPQTGMTMYGKVLEPIEDLKPAILAAVAAIRSGGTWTDAGRAMQENGWPTDTSNGTLYISSVRNLLTSPLLVGYLPHDDRRVSSKEKAHQPGRERLKYVQRDANGVPVQGVDPIMTLTEFLSLQDIIERMSRRRAHQEVALLAGVAECGKCGRRMHRSKVGRRGSGQQVYTCGGCNGVSVITTHAEEKLTKAILARFTADAVRDQAAAYEKEAQAIIEATPEANRTEVREMQAMLDDITELMTTTTSKAGRAALQRKFDETAARIDELTLTPPGLPTLGNVAGIVEDFDLRVIWPELTADQRNAIVREAVERVAVRPSQNGGKRNEAGRLCHEDDRLVVWWRGESAPKQWPVKVEES